MNSLISSGTAGLHSAENYSARARSYSSERATLWRIHERHGVARSHEAGLEARGRRKSERQKG